VPAAEVGGKEIGAAEGAVGGVAEGVGLGVVDQEFEAAGRVGAVEA
jgi:hypothetical protein